MCVVKWKDVVQCWPIHVIYRYKCKLVIPSLTDTSDLKPFCCFSLLQHHIKYQHLMKKKYVCPHPSCGRLFRLQKQLLRHAKHHTGKINRSSLKTEIVIMKCLWLCGFFKVQSVLQIRETISVSSVLAPSRALTTWLCIE